MCVIGPMAATATDLTIAYRLMAQPNPSDPAQNLLAVSVPPAPSAKKYLGLCHEWLATADPVVQTIFSQTLAHLTSPQGGAYEVVDIHRTSNPNCLPPFSSRLKSTLAPSLARPSSSQPAKKRKRKKI